MRDYMVKHPVTTLTGMALVLALALSGCGGKTTDDDEDDTVGEGGISNLDGSAPGMNEAGTAGTGGEPSAGTGGSEPMAGTGGGTAGTGGTIVDGSLPDGAPGTGGFGGTGGRPGTGGTGGGGPATCTPDDLSNCRGRNPCCTPEGQCGVMRENVCVLRDRDGGWEPPPRDGGDRPPRDR